MKYKALTPINHDHTRYEVGDIIELDEKEAAELLNVKAIELSIQPFSKPVEKTALHINSQED